MKVKLDLQGFKRVVEYGGGHTIEVILLKERFDVTGMLNNLFIDGRSTFIRAVFEPDFNGKRDRKTGMFKEWVFKEFKI